MKKILIQLDTDRHASAFDRVVAVDADVDELFSYAQVEPDHVEPLVHGAIFTRGPNSLKNTALFVGGSNVTAGEQILAAVQKAFFGPMRVSVMMDSNGSNTTAAAAVLAALRHLDASESQATILGGTGPVGLRAAQLLSQLGARVRLVSRSQARAQDAVDSLSETSIEPVAADDEASVIAACQRSDLILAAGAAGIQFLSQTAVKQLQARVLIDVNAVPPVGIAGVDVMDAGSQRDGRITWGAIGVGGIKMKIHKAAIRRLFTASDLVLDTSAIFQLGRELFAESAE